MCLMTKSPWLWLCHTHMRPTCAAGGAEGQLSAGAGVGLRRRGAGERRRGAGPEGRAPWTAPGGS